MPAPHAAISVLPFTPSAAEADALIQAFQDPALSLADLARTHDTTIEALTLWLTEADTRQRLVAVDSAACWRARHIANAHLSSAISALLGVIKQIGKPALRAGTPNAPARDPINTDPDPAGLLRAELLHLRRLDSARKAAAALIRLTRHRPLSPFAPAVEEPGPANPTRRAASQPPQSPAPAHNSAPGASPSPMPVDESDTPSQAIEALIALLNQAAPGFPATPEPVRAPTINAAPATQADFLPPTSTPLNASTQRAPHRRAPTTPSRATALALAAGAYSPSGP